MHITDLLAQMGGVSSLAQHLGISETQATSGAQALLPAILGGFKKQALTEPAGIGGVLGLLGRLGGSAMSDQVLGAQAPDLGAGHELLGKIFGRAEVSEAVAEHAARQTGLDSSVLMRMLPMLAMLVGGFVTKQGTAAAAGGLKGLWSGLVGGGKAAGLATPAAAPALTELLDLKGEGNPLDEILKTLATH